MQRSFGGFIFLTVLILGLGVGEILWTRYKAPGCQEWQAELQRRVEAYARMHLPEPAPQVQVQSTCGHASIPDSLFFRWRMFAFRMGLRAQKPLDEGDLRMAGTRDLMQHPDMGNLKFVIRFDAGLSLETRKRVEELISRYLQIDEQRQRLEFKRMKKSADNPVPKALAPPMEPLPRGMRTPLLESPEPDLRASLIRASNILFVLILVCLGGFFVFSSRRPARIKSRKNQAPETTPASRDSGAFAILFAPRVLLDYGERGRELWRLLLVLDERKAARRVLLWWEKDKDGLVQFLGFLPPATQESVLRYLTTDQLLKLTEAPTLLQGRDAQRAGLRLLLDLGREIASCSRLPANPIFLHLMTKREWQRVAQQMTRPRRRALAELLDKERAGWLRARQDLHPGWFHTGSKEDMNAEQLTRRVRSVLQVDADQLREQLYADREAVAVIDSYFAELTLDAGLNSDLAMLVLGECLHRQAGFGRLVERRDPNLLTALQHFDDQQVALLLYECDPQLKAHLYASLGPRQDAITVLVDAMEQDRHHHKSLRMQARSLQRFVERQVLVADLLCTTTPTR